MPRNQFRPEKKKKKHSNLAKKKILKGKQMKHQTQEQYTQKREKSFF